MRYSEVTIFKGIEKSPIIKLYEPIIGTCLLIIPITSNPFLLFKYYTNILLNKKVKDGLKNLGI